MSDFPIRINKYLAQKGYATRRGADVIIEKGIVFINEKKAALGDKVNETDTVRVETPKLMQKKYIYLAYNKPKGLATEDIKKKGVFPMGRLDKDSHGLIILTNDGRITDRLLNPERSHDKEYLVKTARPLRPSFEKHMSSGVDIGDYVTRPCKVDRISDTSFAITLTEGKKHQIRRMCVALHQDVVDLKRTRIMNIKLGSLKENQNREITGKELLTFLKMLGL